MIDHIISMVRRKLQSMDLWSIINRSLFLMNMMGVHPAKVGSRVQNCVFVLLIINFCITTYWMAMLFVKEEKDFIMFIMSLENVLCTVHATLYLSFLYIQRSGINQLLTEMREKFWDISNYTDKELVHCHQKNVCRVNHLPNKQLTPCLYIFTGDNLIFASYLPEGMPFWVLFTWQHIPGVGLVLLEVAMDFLICSILSLTAMQYTLLRYELERVFGDYPGKKENEKTVSERISRCNDQLTFLLSFKNTINEVFSSLMLVYIAVVVLILCFEIYLLFQMESIEHMIKILLYSGFMFFEFFICFCYPAQDLTAAAEKLANSIYFSDWYDYPNHHKEILMLIGKSQIRVVFMAGGLLEALKTTMIDRIISMVRRKLQSMDLWSIINRSLFLMNMMGVHPAKVGSRVQNCVFVLLIINFCITTYWMAMFFFVKEEKDFIMFVMSLENVLCTVHMISFNQMICLYQKEPRSIKSMYELERVFGDYPGKKENGKTVSERIRRCNDQLTFLLRESIEHMIKILLYSGFMFFEFFICFCYPAQDLTAGAEKLANSIYFSDWYDYPNHHKEILMLIGKSSQECLLL
nr:unnamed protein product [Callosobruchus analis]